MWCGSKVISEELSTGMYKERTYWNDDPDCGLWKIEYRNVFKNELHREDGPARIIFNTSGNIQRIGYYQNGQQHRKNGPCMVMWHDNRNKETETYSVEGELHRTDGPAITHWNEDGTVYKKMYWIHGQEISEREFLRRHVAEKFNKRNLIST